MTSVEKIATLDPESNLADAADLLLELETACLPVVKPSSAPLGVTTGPDALRVLLERRASRDNGGTTGVVDQVRADGRGSLPRGGR